MGLYFGSIIVNLIFTKTKLKPFFSFLIHSLLGTGALPGFLNMLILMGKNFRLNDMI